MELPAVRRIKNARGEGDKSVHLFLNLKEVSRY